jgi:hypothetical protein
VSSFRLLVGGRASPTAARNGSQTRDGSNIGSVTIIERHMPRPVHRNPGSIVGSVEERDEGDDSHDGDDCDR